MPSDEETNDKKVLLLGAGASAASDFKLPVMSGFFQRDSEEFSNLFDFIEWFYPGRASNEYNIEEVLAFLNISRTRLAVWGLPPGMGQQALYGELYSDMLRYVRQRLETPSGQQCNLHRALFKYLNEQDSILTLNYDLVFDHVLSVGSSPGGDNRLSALRKLLSQQPVFDGMQPPAHPYGSTFSGFYLKLHGSLNWLICPTEGCPNHTNIFCCDRSNVERGQVAGAPCRVCGAALQIMIIPPVTAKRLEDRGRIAFLWNLALRELRRAHTAVFIGTSFAATDFELRWLVREGLGSASSECRRIEIVNPCEEHRQTTRSMFSRDSCEIKEYEDFESYLEENSG